MPSMNFKLDINLGDYKSIQNATKVLGKLSSGLDYSVSDGLENTSDLMRDYAEQKLADYGLAGSEVANSLQIQERGGIVKLIATSDHADFVEYGTGVVGEESPHPQPSGWEYDVNFHGDAGWLYYDENKQKIRWTAGMPSRPFMYETWLYGSRIVGSQITKSINKLLKRVGL